MRPDTPRPAATPLQADHPIYRWRESQGWTQNRLARAIGVKQQHVSSWESGRNLPSLESAYRLIQLSGGTLTIKDFLQGYRHVRGLPT